MATAIQFANNVHNLIFSDPRVRALLDKITPRLPTSRFIAITLGSGLAAGAISFIILPILGFTGAGIAANSAAAAIQSAVHGAAIPAGSIFAILQSLGATASLVPALLIGTITAGAVAAVQLVENFKTGLEANQDGNSNENAKVGSDKDPESALVTGPEDARQKGDPETGSGNEQVASSDAELQGVSMTGTMGTSNIGRDEHVKTGFIEDSNRPNLSELLNWRNNPISELAKNETKKFANTMRLGGTFMEATVSRYVHTPRARL